MSLGVQMVKERMGEIDDVRLKEGDEAADKLSKKYLKEDLKAFGDVASAVTGGSTGAVTVVIKRLLNL